MIVSQYDSKLQGAPVQVVGLGEFAWIGLARGLIRASRHRHDSSEFVFS